MIKFPVDRAIQYRQELEQVYVALILQLVHCGHTELDIAMLLHARLQSPLAAHLQQWQQTLYLCPQIGTDIEYAVLHALLTYFNKVKRLRNDYWTTTRQRLLEAERQALGLQPRSAYLINTLLLSSPNLNVQNCQSQACLVQNFGAVAVSCLNQASSGQVDNGQNTNEQNNGGNKTTPIEHSTEAKIYRQLEHWLRQEEWQQANQTTLLLMIEIAEQQNNQDERQAGGQLSISDLRSFPCAELHTIDRLWLQFSGGRFGFSVQRQLWRQYRDVQQFAARVGWRKVVWLRNNGWLKPNEFKFSLRAERGHLPALPMIVNEDNCAAYMTALTERLEVYPTQFNKLVP